MWESGQAKKLHEEMITETDALNTLEFDDYYVILPSTPLWDLDDFAESSGQSKAKKVKDNFAYNSGTNPDFLEVSAIRELADSELNG